MRQLFIFKWLCFFIAVGGLFSSCGSEKYSRFIQEESPLLITSSKNSTEQENLGARQALAFEKERRGHLHPWLKEHPERDHRLWEKAYPEAEPIPLTHDLKNIIPLTPKMWSKEHVWKHFHANKQEGQVAPLVFVKTEFCHKNGARPCSVTTAAFEKQSTPLMSHFKVYSAWVRGNPMQKGWSWKNWEKKVIREYEFKQGPGPRIAVLMPGGASSLKTTAASLDLVVPKFEEHEGKTPELEAFLKEALKRVEQFQKWNEVSQYKYKGNAKKQRR